MIVKLGHESTSELPKLIGEIMLEVYTHKSIKSASSSVREYDNERLALLGKSALDMAVTYVLFVKRPFQSAEDLAVRTA
jgi:dsRNA-specific ribonuclease